jgi:DNA-binding beta-propeller fold protein YncE
MRILPSTSTVSLCFCALSFGMVGVACSDGEGGTQGSSGTDTDPTTTSDTTPQSTSTTHSDDADESVDGSSTQSADSTGVDTETGGDTEGDADPFELWAMDQGTNSIWIFDEELEYKEQIDLDGIITRPHMIDFTAAYDYAFVANTVSGDVAILRTNDRELVSVVPTGPGSHAANVAPSNDFALVDVMGEDAIKEIVFDLADESFSIGRTLVIADDPVFAERAEDFDGSKPICQAFTPDGKYAYVTLGPGFGQSGLVILDTETFTLEKVFPPSEVSSNCGAMLSPDGTKMWLNGGSLDAGVFYVFDVSDHTLIHSGDSGGLDTHGQGFTPNANEVWMVHRASSDASIVDPVTYGIIDTMAFVGKSPDILVFSPAGDRLFVTTRGPNPLSGPHAIAGDTPGFAVIDVPSRTLLEVVQPDGDNEESDFHGIGLIPLR